MRNRVITLLTAALALASTAQAKSRSRTQIMEAAKAVLEREVAPLQTDGQHNRVQATRRLKVLREDKMLTIVGYEGGGYAVVTNDDLLPEVVGYSAHTFNDRTDNENFLWWWNAMETSAQAHVQRGIAPKRVRPDLSKYQAEVPQMLTTVWGQMEPYNNLCPLEYDRNGNVKGRTVVGCVATACAQVMNYLQYPTQGTGRYTDSQNTDAWGQSSPITVDFADYTFDYSLLRDSYTPGSYNEQSANEVAELSYAIGVSFGMMYGVEGSGTTLDIAAASMKNHLGFKYSKYYNRGNYEDVTWMNLIFNELSNNRPVVYGGMDDLFTIGGGGHCFVFDGYDANGLVHVNWGWYGSYDGYYDVSLLNPGIHGFKNSQDMIVGLDVPDEGAAGEKSLTLSGELDENTLRSLVEQSKSCGLRHLDLSNAELVAGELPAQAFYGSRLQTIILPANTQHIGDGAFGNCRNLTSVVFPTPNDEQDFRVEDNIIYTKDGKEVIEVLPYYKNTKAVMDDYVSLLTFHEGVESLHDYALDGCFRIKGVVIPSSVERIGKHIFSHASSIKQVQSATSSPATAILGAFDAIDAGYTRLVIPAGTWDTYCRAGEWKHFFALDNVVEVGTNIKARNVVRPVGTKNPEFRYQMFGDYVTGEPVLTCEADENSPAGEYPIVVEIGSIMAPDVVLTNGILRIVDESTGIEDVESAGSAASGAKQYLYTLDGRKANAANLSRGVYVTKGKKVLK